MFLYTFYVWILLFYDCPKHKLSLFNYDDLLLLILTKY